MLIKQKIGIRNAGEGKRDVWNEKFRFQVEYKDTEEDEDHMNNKLVLSVMDKHPFNSDFLVGKTT